MALYFPLQVELTVTDIESILNTLIYDGKVESSIAAGAGGESGSEQVTLYRAVPSLVPTTGLMRTPCGVCPVSWLFCLPFLKYIGDGLIMKSIYCTIVLTMTPIV